MKSILAFVLLLSGFSAMAEVPTIIIPLTNGAPSQLTSPKLYGITSSVFSYPQLPPMLFTNQNGDNIRGYVTSTHTAWPYDDERPLTVQFTINAQQFEVFCGPATEQGTFTVSDGTSITIPQNIQGSVNTNGAHGFNCLALVRYSSKAIRTITIQLSGTYADGLTFGGINVQSGDTISAVANPPVLRTLVVLGDSYDEGYSVFFGSTNPVTPWLGSFAVQLANMGTDISGIPDGEGGTGYVNPGTESGFTNYYPRLQELITNRPHFLLLTGGYNDQAYATNTLVTNPFYVAVTNVFAWCKRNLTNTEIAVCSDFTSSPKGEVPQTWVNMDTMITNAAAIYGFPWVSPIQNYWFNTNNENDFLGADGAHPTYYGYRIYATNLNNFMAASFIDWNIANTNPASATFVASPTNASAPLGVNFAYTGTNGSSFAWSFGDGGTSAAQNPQYTYSAAGVYNVSLVVNGSVTQTSPNLITVTNPSVPPSNPASATFNASPMIGGAPTLVSFAYAGTNGTSFAWSFGDGGTSTSQNPSYVYGSPGNFSPTLVVNGTGTYTLPSPITITNTITAGVSGSSLNVTNFGAVGDEAQVWVNTTSGSVVVQFTNALTSADIGKTIELFGVGEKNTGNNVSGAYVTRAQDLIDIITNVVNGNAYVSGDIPTVTSNGVYCIYGSNDSQAFQAAVNAASGTNTVINIPVGRFLLIPPCSYTNFNNALPYLNYFAVKCAQGIILTKGGIHFAGAGPNLTALVAQGGFKDQGGYCLRGGIFNCIGPITNDYPLIWDSLTFDGGMQTAFTGNEGTQPANSIDGEGWDGSSYAGLDSGSEPLQILKEFTNCRFQHFRGEMIKGITSTAGNETILVTNCVFADGNATCFNYNFAHTITDCTFSNMYQIEEFYLKYPTNGPSYFVNNYATNVQHNFISLNGGSATNEPYIIAGNLFCQNGGNGIQTTPASNVSIVSNQFNCAVGGYSINIVLGAAGYQGYWDNSNILISANSFYNPAIILEIAGAVSPTDVNGVENVQVCSNLLYATVGQQCQALQVYNWCTNVHIFNNDFLTHAAGSGNIYWGSGAFGYPYVTVDANDVYIEKIGNFTGTPQTNVFSYANGPRHQTIQSISGDAYVLSDSDSNQIPSTAQMVLDNSVNGGTGSYKLFLNSAMTRSISVTNGEIVTASWVGRQWIATTGVTNNPASPMVSSISANVSNLGTNPAVLIANPGPVQLSATASAYNNDSLSWQWGYSVNGGSQTIYAVGSGANPVINFMNNTNAGGNTNVWTLQVTDTKYGLSAQSQITIVVVLPPPLGMQIGLHASTN